MSTVQNQEQFIKLVKAKFSDNELEWLEQKTAILSNPENIEKFPLFFSLTSRFISKDIPKWELKELDEMEQVYPGFSKSSWTKQHMVRVILMITLDVSTNKRILESFFEVSEMQELIAFFKGLYLLENAEEFTEIVEEGIRTNMVNVFDSFSSGNPFPLSYLEEWAWNQLVLKALFLERPLYTIQNIDEGKNKNLADMLQDYVKERWSADRPVSPEIWRMIEGYLRQDIKMLLLEREFKATEKQVIDHLLSNNNDENDDFWDTIGKLI
jgi:hypothetical protein